MVTGMGRQETLQLLQLDQHLLDRMREMHGAGESAEAILKVLRRRGVPKPGASVALRLAEIASLQDARSIVEHSEVYASWPDEDHAEADLRQGGPLRADQPSKVAA